MAFVESFAPIARADARLLIVGSMPGVASLAAVRYYHNPRNAFWAIVGALLGLAPDADYDARCRALPEAGIALWDVLQRCERPGSGDADIVAASARANDFAAFFRRHRRVAAVFCNGNAADRLYHRLVLPTLPAAAAALPRAVLPSTSPANARLGFDAKLQQWRAALAPLLASPAGGDSFGA